MKKLLVILAVTGIITGSSLKLISCGINPLRKDLSKIKINIALNELKNVTKDQLLEDLAKELIQKKISNVINFFDEDDIANDSNLEYRFFYRQNGINKNLLDKIDVIAKPQDQYFTGKTTFKVKVDLGRVDLTIQSFEFKDGGNGQDLLDKVHAKLADLLAKDEINKETIATDSNLKITIDDKYVEDFKEDTLTAKTYEIKIVADNDDYFTGKGKTNVKLTKAKIDLPTIEPIILDKFILQDDAKELVQKEIANATGLTENNIKNDKNLKYEFWKSQLGKEYEKITDLTEKLRNGNSNYIKVIANRNDQYFNPNSSEDEGKFYIKINKVNLLDIPETDLKIDSFEASGKKGEDLIDKVSKKLAHFSGYWEYEIWNIIKSDWEGLKDCIKITDASDNSLWKDDPLISSQTYTITFTGFNNDLIFTGKAKFIVTLKESDLATADFKIEPFCANGQYSDHLVDKVFDQLTELSGLSNKELWKHSDDLNNDFIKITDESGERLKKDQHLIPQTYKVRLKALDDDDYFIGRNEFIVKVEKFDLSKIEPITKFKGVGKTGKQLFFEAIKPFREEITWIPEDQYLQFLSLFKLKFSMKDENNHEIKGDTFLTKQKYLISIWSGAENPYCLSGLENKAEFRVEVF